MLVTIRNLLMYLRYFRKVIYLKLLQRICRLDFTGREQSSDNELCGYEGCYPVRKLLKNLKISAKDSILDIGCGKGLFLYYAIKYPFKKIDGVERSQVLVEIARRNIARLQDERIHVFHTDVRDFNCFRDYNFFFINNPFNAAIMETVANAILESHRERKTKTTVIYQFPCSRHIFERLGFRVQYSRFPNIILTLE